jgi:hypothetical protein
VYVFAFHDFGFEIESVFGLGSQLCYFLCRETDLFAEIVLLSWSWNLKKRRMRMILRMG